MEGLGKDPGPDETDGFDMRKSMQRDVVSDDLQLDRHGTRPTQWCQLCRFIVGSQACQTEWQRHACQSQRGLAVINGHHCTL